MHITIKELTGQHRQWISSHRTGDAVEAIRRAMTRHWGAQHGFKQDSGLPTGYGSIIRNLSRTERGSGSTWAAEVVLGRVRINNVIDSRDIIARIAELEAARDDAAERYRWAINAYEAESDPENSAPNLTDFQMDEDDTAELAALLALEADAEGYADDWRYGVTLIRDSYFEDYARELAEEIGAMDPNASWPLTCIDWAEAARQLQQDYTAVEFDGVTYWVR